MKFSAPLARRLSWLNLPGALLLALLQRTPVVPAALLAEEGTWAAPFGAVVRSAFAAAASFGAIHSLAGATQVVASTYSVNGTVGTPIAQIGFVTNNAPTNALSYVITGVPPGITVPGLNPTTNILNVTNQLGSGSISGTPTTAGSFSMKIQAWEFSNAQGNSSVPITILFTISPSNASGPPTITSQPVDLVSAVGESATFTIGVTTGAGATYQWKHNGIDVPGATGSSLSIGNLLLSDAGNYAVAVTNSFGTVLSAAASLNVNATSSAPAFLLQPTSQTVAAGATVVFTALANGVPTPTYQWQRNGLAITTATSPTLVLTGANVIAGNYTVAISNTSNTVASSVARLIVQPTNNPGHLKNLSVLARITAADPGFTVATVIGPPGISGNKPLLVRAAGPSLGQLGVPGALPDPKVTMFQGASAFAANDNWGTVAGLAPIFARVGAFPFVATTSLDAALYNDTTPAGSYSVQVSGAPGQSGPVIAEIYDAAANFAATAPRLVNVSVLKTIPAGDFLTAGFVIEGDTALTVLVRAIGPGLAGVGVTSGFLVDPKLELFNAASTSVAINDNWGGDTQVRSAMTAVGAFALSDTGSKDAVLLVTLAPGSYSAQVRGVGTVSGLALVEVYEVR